MCLARSRPTVLTWFMDASWSGLLEWALTPPLWHAEAVGGVHTIKPVGQHPPVQGGVVDLEAPLQEQLLDVAVAERIAQIPGDGLQDQRGFVVPALEIGLGSALQLLDKGVQDHRPPPVRRRIWRPHAQRGVNAKTLRHVWTPLEEQEKSSRAVWPVVGC